MIGTDAMNRCFKTSFILAAVLSLGACEDLTNPGYRQGLVDTDKSFSGSGTVRFSDLEGGYFFIESSTGEILIASNLEPEFQVEGLGISFVAKPLKEAVSFQSGLFVELSQVAVLSDE